MTERALQAAVLDLATYLGWRSYHTFDSRRSSKGFPDLCMAHPTHGVMFRELKAEKGRVSAHQVEWLAALVSAGADAKVWNVADWQSGLILAELKGE